MLALLFPLASLPFLVGDRPAWVVSLASQPEVDPLSLLITYGPLGIFLAMLAGGQFRTKYEVQRLERQVGAAETEIARLLGELARAHTEAMQKDELNRAFQMQIAGHTLPALAQSARVFEAIPHVETGLEDELRRVNELVAQLTQQVSVLREGTTRDGN